jgi:hypothetical protein
VTIITVKWPAVTATHAEVLRVLDLSGITHSFRESRRAIRSGATFLNGELCTLRTKVEVGSTFYLEVRGSNGILRGKNIFLTKEYFSPQTRRYPAEEHRRG